LGLWFHMFRTRKLISIIQNYSRKLQRDQLNAFLELNVPTGPKLHLGCGETYLHGYVNIDLPPSKHTVMRNVKPDVYADLKEIRFPLESVALVRSHHVFEHFDRPTALVMLIEWYQWLKGDGVVVIETPDFEKAAKRVLSSKCRIQERLVPLRHIFGSHEASWAYHLDGWFKDKFILFLERLGYQDVHFLQFSHGSLDYIIVKARKRRPIFGLEGQAHAAEQLLSYGLVSAQYEQPLFDVWKKRLRDQLLSRRA
jgi:predicted SAM-dependent methyltransferase